MTQRSLLFGIAWMALATDAKHTLTTTRLMKLRGGASSSSSPYELNPNYVPGHAPARPVTVGDLEKRRVMHGPPPQEVWVETTSYERRTFIKQQSSLSEQIQSYVTQLHRMSPTLSLGTAVCLVVFCLWHLAPFQIILQKYFVCSRINVLQKKRYPALLLSALSHASPSHLIVNIFAFLTFGPTVRQLLMTKSAITSGSGINSGWPLWPLVVGAAMAGSTFYLLLAGRGGGGCMGLSGVTLALMAMTAQAYPQKEIGFVIGVIPIRLPAQIALGCLLLWSLLGSIASMSGGIAHSAHLGGLLFGMGYYELWLRRQDLRFFAHRARRMLVSKRQAKHRR